MLVSAAMEPYRKSYGKARSSAAVAAGSRSAARSTASPRKTCVPGVYAQSVVGQSATATPAATSSRAKRIADEARGNALETDAAALLADRAPQLAYLIGHRVVDRPARVGD